jgi:hypothetical protein
MKYDFKNAKPQGAERIYQRLHALAKVPEEFQEEHDIGIIEVALAAGRVGTAEALQGLPRWLVPMNRDYVYYGMVLAKFLSDNATEKLPWHIWWEQVDETCQEAMDFLREETKFFLCTESNWKLNARQ